MITKILSVSVLAFGLATSAMVPMAMAQASDSGSGTPGTSDAKTDGTGEQKSQGADDSSTCTTKEAAAKNTNGDKTKPICAE